MTPHQERQGGKLRHCRGEDSDVKYGFPTKSPKEGPANSQTLIGHPALSPVACSRVE